MSPCGVPPWNSVPCSRCGEPADRDEDDVPRLCDSCMREALETVPCPACGEGVGRGFLLVHARARTDRAHSVMEVMWT